MARKSKAATQEIAQLPIEGELTIFVVQEMKEAILPVIANNDEIEIDLSNVTEVDGAGMQMMASIKLEAILQGKTLRYVGHSKPILDMLDLCDLGGFFGDQVVMHAKA